MTVKTRTLVLSFSSSDIDEYVSTLENDDSIESIVVGFNGDFKSKITNKGVCCKNSDDYLDLDTYMNLNDDVISWLQTWSSKKILHGKNFKELVAYENLSFWWVEQYLFYTHILKIGEYICKMEQILDTEKPDHIILFGDEDILPIHIVQEISKLKNIPVSIQHTRNNLNSNLGLKNIPNQWSLIISFLSRTIIAKFMWFPHMFKLKSSKQKQNKILMTSATVYFQKIIESKTGTIENYDVMMENIIKELYKNPNNETVVLLRQHPPYPTIFDFIKIKNPYLPIEYYFTISTLIKASKESKRFIGIWKELKNEDDFKKFLTYRGVPLFEILDPYFNSLFSERLSYYVGIFEQMKHAISIEKPDIIITESEHAVVGISMIAIARKQGIPTIAVQHGFVIPFTLAYKYTSDEISNNYELSPNYCPLADKTTVFGPYMKMLLTKFGHYPSDSIAVTGGTRYERLAQMKDYINKNEICKRLNIDPNKKIILFGMTILDDEAMRGVQLKIVIEAMKELPEVQMVVKLHPQDSEDRYKRLVQKLGANNVIIVKDIPLHDTIYACDVFLMEYSTVGFEALILGKPVICLQMHKKFRFDFHDESGALMVIHRSEDLIPKIRNILEDIEHKEKSDDEKIDGAYYFTYKKDGKASKRIVDLIDKTLLPNPGNKEQ